MQGSAGAGDKPVLPAVLLAGAFDGMTPVSRQGATDLVGEVVDQAHLYGLLARISGLGLELESVELHEHKEA